MPTRSEKTVHCQCGEVTGERCLWTGPASATVALEYVPPADQGEIRQHPHIDWSGSWRRVRVERSCAALLDNGSDPFVRAVKPTETASERFSAIAARAALSREAVAGDDDFTTRDNEDLE